VHPLKRRSLLSCPLIRDIGDLLDVLTCGGHWITIIIQELRKSSAIVMDRAALGRDPALFLEGMGIIPYFTL
jgi:hypothetical protein